MSQAYDLLPGQPTFVWVSLPSATLPTPVTGHEILLSRTLSMVTAELHHPDLGVVQWVVRPRDAEDDDRLRRLVREAGDPGATVALLDGRDDTGTRPWLRLRIFVFDEVQRWSPIAVGVDRPALESARRVSGDPKLRNPDAARRWLRTRLRLPPAPGSSTPRVVALVGPDQSLHEPAPCRLLGSGIVASLTQSKGVWLASKVHRHAAAVPPGNRAVLVHVDVDVVDMSVEAQLRQQMREELRRLADAGASNTFLALWQEYHEMENRLALSRVKALDHLSYHRFEPLDDADDIVRVFLSGDDVGREAAVLEQLEAELHSGGEVELEFASALPEVLGGATPIDPTAGLLDLDRQRNEVGVLLAVDAGDRTADLRLDRRQRRVAGVGPSARRSELPVPGFLHAAVAGDYQRLHRRRQALQRLLDGRIPIPQLLTLLQGQLARGRPRKSVPPLSDAARAMFKGEPQPAQIEALNAALNTPDIAVIQGPPGTGKTQVIAALQVRLAEERRPHTVLSRSVLLTSYQHAAVDNLVERSKVMDLPAIKVDSQNRGSTEHIDTWRRETIEALDRAAGTEEGQRARALREVSRETVTYAVAPMSAEALPGMLARVIDRVRDLVADDLLVRLESLRSRLAVADRIATVQADPRRQTALRAARSLRCTEVGFADDGPEVAATALAVLTGFGGIDGDVLEPVQQAADWLDDGVPLFLGELRAARDLLIDQLSPAPRLTRPAARDDVLDLLEAVVADLDERRRSSEEGVERALLDYLEDLRGDPEAVRATLQLYTVSLAATCQQADSRGVREAKDGDELFDTVIVDEAARANPLDLLIPLTKAARRIVLVGDHRQLPHMLEPDVEQQLRSLDQLDRLELLRKSMFGRLYDLLRTDPKLPRRAVRLNTQFRMHQVLGEFVSRNFYDGQLRSTKPDSEFVHDLEPQRYGERPAVWIRVPRSAGKEHAGTSKTRPIEARVIADELRRYAVNRPDLKFGVIAFYSAQVKLIWRELAAAGLAKRSGRDYEPVEALMRDHRGREVRRLQVGTVDAFQGKEFDVAFLSVTRSSEPRTFPPDQRLPLHPRHREYLQWLQRTYGHLMIVNRLCVALSRQERLLVVVGDDALFEPHVAPPQLAALTDFLGLCAAGRHGVRLELGA